MMNFTLHGYFQIYVESYNHRFHFAPKAPDDVVEEICYVRKVTNSCGASSTFMDLFTLIFDIFENSVYKVSV